MIPQPRAPLMPCVPLPFVTDILFESSSTSSTHHVEPAQCFDFQHAKLDGDIRTVTHLRVQVSQSTSGVSSACLGGPIDMPLVIEMERKRAVRFAGHTVVDASQSDTRQHVLHLIHRGTKMQETVLAVFSDRVSGRHVSRCDMTRPDTPDMNAIMCSAWNDAHNQSEADKPRLEIRECLMPGLKDKVEVMLHAQDTHDYVLVVTYGPEAPLLTFCPRGYNSVNHKGDRLAGVALVNRLVV